MDSAFQTAIDALYSTEHQSKTKEAIQAAAGRRTRTIEDMKEYLVRARLLNAFDASVRVVHISGTKGKGSVACMCESILRRANGENTGLFTSPHLVDIRERIRINGLPVSKSIFGKAYWEVRRRLEEHEVQSDCDLPRLPGYFRMLTLVSYYIFSRIRVWGHKLSVVVFEVGMGGRYDATNSLHLCFPKSKVVRAVTLIDYDHVRVLGNTLEEIAWEKGGIFGVHGATTPHPKRDRDQYLSVVSKLGMDTSEPKENVCFTLDSNSTEVLAVLRSCAQVEGCGMTLCPRGSQFNIPDGWKIGLPGKHQVQNAELAYSIVEAISTSLATTAALNAISLACWPGRCQTIDLPSSQVRLHLDGAHTVEAMTACLAWFTESTNNRDTRKILIFNCSHERDPFPLLQLFQTTPLYAVYFCKSDHERPSAVTTSNAVDILKQNGYKLTETQKACYLNESSWQHSLHRVFHHIYQCCDEVVERDYGLSVSAALKQIRHLGDSGMGPRIDVLLTGSLYLVGSALASVDWTEPDGDGSLVVV